MDFIKVERRLTWAFRCFSSIESYAELEKQW